MRYEQGRTDEETGNVVGNAKSQHGQPGLAGAGGQ